MKAFFLGLLASIFSATINAQIVDFEWAISVGDTLVDYGVSISTDVSGNVYTTGLYNGTVDFDSGPGTFNLTSNGDFDIFIQKLDATGNFIWAKSIGGIQNDWSNSITTDATGNVYITGKFRGVVDFDPGPATFNLTSLGSDDIFIQKLDANGDLIWASSIGSTSTDNGNSITTDDLDNVYITGSYHSTIDCDPGAGTFNLTSIDPFDTFIQKLDANGNFIWAKSIGGMLNENGHSITTDDLGNVYTAGVFQLEADFGPGTSNFVLTSNGSYDIFIQKMDASGNFVWAKSVGGSGKDWAYSIVADTLGYVYVTGYYTNTVDFDPGPATFDLTSNGGQDIFIQKLDSDGNLIWVKSLGGIGTDHGDDVHVDVSGNVYLAGHFEDTVDFDPDPGTYNLSSNGADDIYVLKISQCYTNYGTEIVTAYDSYTWINGVTYTSNNDSDIYTLTNVGGCDSIVTLDLTMIPCIPMLPEAFSPNGDGVNDVLLVRGGGFTVTQFAIYNRYGQRVFTTDDPTTGWDGTFRDKELNPGVFVYRIHYTCLSNNQTGFVTGNITLMK